MLATTSMQPELEFLDHVVAKLKSLREEIFFTGPSSTKTPQEYFSQLIGIINTVPLNLCVDEIQTDLIVKLAFNIRDKCLVDMEYETKMDTLLKAYANVSTVPGILFDEGSREKAKRVPLYQWFIENKSHPYPDENKKKLLAGQTGMTITQINHYLAAEHKKNPEDMRRDGNTYSSISNKSVSTNATVKYAAAMSISPVYILPPNMTIKEGLERARIRNLTNSLISNMNNPQYIWSEKAWLTQQHTSLAELGFGELRTCDSLNRAEKQQLIEMSRDGWSCVRPNNIYASMKEAEKGVARKMKKFECGSYRRNRKDTDVSHGEKRVQWRTDLKLSLK
ncbi:hypothetical protein HK100_005609 [Physocladia obscura]|uniref:KN homeodomain domain-containing protein n=1 Tax=Physocladia obscura TaxID=109957 RepID=A0AAD5X802_9FUNG|nr:hypothetical protein HK100_005609 [Physocladia obscura]